MYKLLITDDNEIQIQSLIDCVNWENYNITEIKTATNGQEALDIFESFRPDIIITDVVMPVMNGITMMEEIKKRGGKDIKFIFMSCYDDYQYIKAAFENEAISYVLKPIDQSEIEKCLSTFVGIQIRQEKYNEMEKIFSEGIKQFRTGFLYKVVGNKNIDTENLRSEIKALRFNEYNCFSIMKIYVNDCENRDNMYKLIDVFDSSRSCFETETIEVIEKDNLLMSLLMTKSLEKDAFLNEINNISVYYSGIAKDKYGLDLTISFSEAHSSLENIYMMDREAMISLKNELEINNEESYEKESDYLTVEYTVFDLQKNLETLIENPDEKHWEMFFGIFCSPEVLSNKYLVKSLYVMTYSAVQIILNKRNLQIENIWKDLNDSTKKHAFETHEEITRWFRKIIKAIINYINMNEMETYEKFVMDVNNYIEQHYADISGINEITDHFYMSYSYGRKIYRKHTGHTIFSKLREVRIREAEKLLENGKMRLSEVARSVGYKSKSSFLNAYKKLNDSAEISD